MRRIKIRDEVLNKSLLILILFLTSLIGSKLKSTTKFKQNIFKNDSILDNQTKFNFQNQTTNSIKEKLERKCFALALQGGGFRGAYQAGAMKGFIDKLPQNMRNWDIITGISVGAINAAGMSIYKKEEEKIAVEFIVDLWKNLDIKKDVYKSWFFGELQGLNSKTGLYNTKPLKEFLEKQLKDKPILRNIAIGATNLNTGNYTSFEEKFLSNSIENFINGLMASSASPVFFPYIQINDQKYTDGGVSRTLDIPSAIHKCKDNGYEQKNIIVDVILCNQIVITEYKETSRKPIDVLFRVLEINYLDRALHDIEESIINFPDVNFRYLVIPRETLPIKSLPTEYTKEEMEKMIKMGMEDAENVLSEKDGYFFK